jgi:hypothetical protein
MGDVIGICAIRIFFADVSCCNAILWYGALKRSAEKSRRQ